MIDIKKILDEKGIYAAKTVGNSMNPMLVQGRDTVIIKKPEFPLKKYDIPVYIRGDHYTMHRIIKVKKDGYVINGDNRPDFERDITDKDIIGVLAAFYHNGEYIECGSEVDIQFAKQARRTHPSRYVKYVVYRVRKKLCKLLNRG